MIRYFVSFAYMGRKGPGPGQPGFWWVEVSVAEPISGEADLRRLQKEMEKEHPFWGISILNWRRFEDEK